MNAKGAVTSSKTQGTCERCSRPVSGLGITDKKGNVYHGICWERELTEHGYQFQRHTEGQSCLRL